VFAPGVKFVLAQFHNVDVLDFGFGLMLQLEALINGCQVLEGLSYMVYVIVPPLLVPCHLLLARHERHIEVPEEEATTN
jgi:hypothetical protein